MQLTEPKSHQLDQNVLDIDNKEKGRATSLTSPVFDGVISSSLAYVRHDSSMTEYDTAVFVPSEYSKLHVLHCKKFDSKNRLKPDASGFYMSVL